MRLFVRAFGCASLIFAASGTPAAAQTPALQILNHAHSNVPDSAQGVAWYQKKFSGDAVPSAGHAVNHIGWRTTNLNAKIEMVQR